MLQYEKPQAAKLERKGSSMLASEIERLIGSLYGANTEKIQYVQEKNDVHTAFVEDI